MPQRYWFIFYAHAKRATQLQPRLLEYDAELPPKHDDERSKQWPES